MDSIHRLGIFRPDAIPAGAYVVIYVALAVLALLGGLKVGSELAIPCRGVFVAGEVVSSPPSDWVRDEGGVVFTTPDGVLIPARSVRLCGDIAYVRRAEIDGVFRLYPGTIREVVVYDVAMDRLLSMWRR